MSGTGTGGGVEDGSDVVRPGPLTWLRYAVVGSVPERHHSWVLHDTTCSTWVLRHAARLLLLFTPVLVVVLFLLPAPLPLRLGVAFAGAATAALLAFGYTTENAEHRIEKAGYPYGLAATLREQRSVTAQRAVAAARREKIAARAARRHR